MSSIAENIAFGIPRGEINLDRVRNAAAQAQIADFIEASPHGYDTFVGERGICPKRWPASKDWYCPCTL